MRGTLSTTALLWAAAGWGAVQAKYAPFMTQSFFFEWDTNPVPIPVVAQCDTLHIKWSRSAATGPNSEAPYYLQVYTSVHPTALVIAAGSDLAFDWPVPFAPNTLFQICMFDKNGNTGGCQRMMTVIAPTAQATCSNVTVAANSLLGVTGTVVDGPFSQYGWIPQCTDLELKPNNGTPPYIYTIATTLHPPYNITSNNMDAVNWTVALSWSSSFFVSVVDSTGLTWARGPLHSGSSLTKDAPTCLSEIAPSTTTAPVVAKSSGIGGAAVAGTGIGGLIVGLLIGLLFTCFVMRKRVRKAKEESDMREQSLAKLDKHQSFATTEHPGSVSNPTEGSALYSPSNYSQHASLAGTTLGNRLNSYQTEPFRMPNEDGTRSPNTYMSPSDDGSIFQGSQSAGPSGSQAAGDRQQVYVVHHDSGRAPVTVYTPDGAEVTELPPQYAQGGAHSEIEESSQGGGSETAPGRLGLHSVLNQSRDVGPNPRKGRAT